MSQTVVVGAGIIGCLTALELSAREPGARITVLERDTAGGGTSRRSAGLHLPRGSTQRVREMSAYSHARYADLMHSNRELPMYPVTATVHCGPEPLTRYLPEANVTASSPGTWRISGTHYSDVYRLVQVLAARLRDREGVTVAEGVAVTGLDLAADSVTVRTGAGEVLAAERVILAPGPWLNATAWRDLVAPLGLRVKRVVALHIAGKPDPADEAVIFDDEDAFLLPLWHRNHWLFSYTCPEWDVDPDAPTEGLSPAHIGAARDILRRHIPALADAISGGRVCCDAYSPSGEPVVAPLDPGGRIVFAGAANGSGYRLAPAIAAEAVRAAGARAAEAA
jgi:glycine/D-amino acid oxidase-like deaminating enzyme